MEDTPGKRAANVLAVAASVVGTGCTGSGSSSSSPFGGEAGETAAGFRGPIPASPYARVRRLPDDILVNLYQIARECWIDAAGQARLFRLDVNTAQAQLSRLAHLGLLDERDGAFVIAVHLRGVLGRVFDERGWVL